MFEGEFRDDKMDGEGKFTTRDGKVIHGFWKNSKLVQ